LPFDKKTRESSGYHKAETLNRLMGAGMNIISHYEDDEVQANIIESLSTVYVIRVINPAVPKENRRQDELITK